MDTFGLGSPNCFVVNLSSLVRRLKKSFCQRANRVIALNRAAILTEYTSVEAVWRSYRLLRPQLMISTWMKNHHLQLNLAKTELMVFPAKQVIHHNINIDSLALVPSKTARNLGVIIDDQLTFT